MENCSKNNLKFCKLDFRWEEWLLSDFSSFPSLSKLTVFCPSLLWGIGGDILNPHF